MNDIPTQIGPYEIVREIGRGGMGVVYLARDTKLDRDVAIKCLPDEMAEDENRLARFRREGKSLAQLNHPNVAGIYGIEEHEGRQYLILEYVEGQTLSQRLDAGSIAVDEALEFAVQIAAGTEAAHDAGVIHRDLKPDNIKITPDGTIKVLDFGLAKTIEESSSTDLENATTLVQPRSPTIEGAILGTAAYMSPEQARGRKLDKRTDIWSFGVVLYELLTGANPFMGESASDSIGAVLHKGLDLDRLPKGTPAGVKRVIARCVERDKDLRYRDIGDVRLELLRAKDEPAEVAAKTAGLSLGLWMTFGVLGVLIGTGSWFGAKATREVEPRVRFESDLVPGTGLELAIELSPVRLSPDGQKVAYLSYLPDDDWVLCVRDLQTGQETILRGPVKPMAPIWSPDGRYLAYFSGTRLERIAIAGGRAEVLAEVGLNSSRVTGDWDERGRILYSDGRGSIYLLERDSTTAVEVIDPVPERAGDMAVMPSFLPDGEHVLYFNQDNFSGDSGLYVGSLVDGTSKRLGSIETAAQYLDPGWLVYWRAGELHLHRFDLERLELVGDSQPVTGAAWRKDWPTVASFSATPETLVYVPSEYDGEENGLFFYDIESEELMPVGPVGSLWLPRISPDGTKVAFDRTTDLTAGDIVVFDFERGVETPLTRDKSNESVPIWSPDGRWVYFTRGIEIYRARSDGSGSPELVVSSPYEKRPNCISPDGKTLIYDEQRDSLDILMMDLESKESTDWLATPFDEFDSDIDDHGDWIVYTSNSSGESRVMVARVTGERSTTLISRGFGFAQRWRGNKITYVTRTDYVSVEVTENDAGELEFGEPEVIMQLRGFSDGDAMPDGKRLLLNRDLKPTRGGRLRIVKNWMPADPK